MDIMDLRVIEVNLPNSQVPVPFRYDDACSSKWSQWVQATHRCVYDIDLAEAGEWVRLDSVSNSISSRFVYQIKVRPDGTVEAFCRWTPRGFEEIAWLHYDPDDIFAATPQCAILRFLLNQALAEKKETFHCDFKRAFSHAPLDRTMLGSSPEYCVYLA